MTQGKALPWLILSQLVVTLGLLGLAYALNDSGIQNLVIGAVIAHWLSESGKLGRQVSDERIAKMVGTGTGDGATTMVVTTTTPAGPSAPTPGV